MAEAEVRNNLAGRNPVARAPTLSPASPNPSNNRRPIGDRRRPAKTGRRRPADAGSGNNQPGQTAAQPDKRPAELHKSAGFGTEFPWAHGKLEAFGRSFDDVGVRYKGNGSYMGSSGSLKRNLKIDLDRYHDDQQFQGIKALNLNAGGVDPTRLREALGFEVFRAAGVPAPRTAFVELTLTVPGKYDHELVGMYTLIEQVDKSFLKDRFGDSSGLLMKPERLRDFAYLGEDWERYTGQYQPKNFPSKKQARRVIEFARLLDKGRDETIRADIDNFLNVDEFLRFLATSAWLSNMDSIFATGHNYYIYLDRQSNKLNFLPWDLDLSFAGFPMMGSADDQMNLSLKHPHGGANKLIDRVLAVPEIGRRYDALLAELASSSFAKDRLLEQIAALEKATAEPRAREQAAVEARNERRRGGPFGGGGFGGMGRSPALNAYVEKRTELVAAQLAGKNPGYTPRGGFGPGGRGGFGPGMFMARPLLTALDTNKDGKLTKDEWLAATTKFFADADAEKRGKLDEAAITAALEQIIPAPPGFGPPRGGAPGEPAAGERGPRDRTPGDQAPRVPAADERLNAAPADRRPEGAPAERPPGFSPAARVAAALVKRADTDHDDQVTLDEAMAAAEALFAEADSDKKSELDENKLAAAINKLFPVPPGFGPPGFGPPGGGPGAGPPTGGPGFGRQDSERRGSDRQDFGFGGPGFGRPGQRSPDPPAGDVPRQPRAEEPQP